MPWTLPRPLPILFMAAPLVLIWPSARAFLCSTAAKVPAATRSAFSYTLLGRRRRCGNGAPSEGQWQSRSMSSSVDTQEARPPGKVVVIAGPTAAGKSQIALSVCEKLGGEIVSCDSVQVYNELTIGANKPSPGDMQRVPHHLVSIASLDCTFTAGQYVLRAREAIDDILSRGKVPVVVGGTMMYVQWLMMGAPDAPKKDEDIARAVEAELQPLKEKDDWQGGLQILAAINETRAQSLSRNDWYRLSRSLEVLRGPQGDAGVFTGRRGGPSRAYDFRAFFIIGDRERLFRRIDCRCEKMLEQGLLRESTDLLVRGILDPASQAGRAIGYKQAQEFLTKDPNIADASFDDAEAGFLEFYHSFAAKTRQYAGDQIKWFRSAKGVDFSWQAWDLGGAIEEGRRKEKVGQRLRVECRQSAPVRAGDGLSLEDVSSSIAEKFQLSTEAFVEDLHGEHQTALRTGNAKRAQAMKHYFPFVTPTSLGDPQIRMSLVREAVELATKVRGVQVAATWSSECY